MMGEAGLQGGELVTVTGFNSSRVTKGVLIRASKGTASLAYGPIGGVAMGNIGEVLPMGESAAKLDPKTKQLIAFGASLATGCEEEARQACAAALANGAAQAELNEAAAIAAKVGAAKVRLLHERIAGSRQPGQQMQQVGLTSAEAPTSQGSGFT